MNIAIIPARGGSKRIPKKNIKDFCGKPMISWAISAAIASNLFDEIVVSTDDNDIRMVALKYGAKVPFIRPLELSDDLTPTVPVIAHAVHQCEELGWKIENVCCIYPCAPFAQPDDLRRALSILLDQNAQFVFPVAEYSHPVQRSMRQVSSGLMEFLMPEFELTRTQDLELLYHDAAQFYWGTKKAWLQKLRMHSGGIGMPIPKWRVIDIDTNEDWMRAEMLHPAFNKMIEI